MFLLSGVPRFETRYARQPSAYEDFHCAQLARGDSVVWNNWQKPTSERAGKLGGLFGVGHTGFVFLVEEVISPDYKFNIGMRLVKNK